MRHGSTAKPWTQKKRAYKTSQGCTVIAPLHFRIRGAHGALRCWKLREKDYDVIKGGGGLMELIQSTEYSYTLFSGVLAGCTDNNACDVYDACRRLVRLALLPKQIKETTSDAAAIADGTIMLVP